eukprot:scaffold402251_cov18-Prasinocladus_malaysianus.AAC.1
MSDDGLNSSMLGASVDRTQDAAASEMELVVDIQAPGTFPTPNPSIGSSKGRNLSSDSAYRGHPFGPACSYASII